MAEILWFLAILLSPLLAILIAYLRLRVVRGHRWHDLDRDTDSLPDQTPYEEHIASQDGLTMGRAMNYDPLLSDIGKRAGAMPDIDKTLQGKR